MPDPGKPGAAKSATGGKPGQRLSLMAWTWPSASTRVPEAEELAKSAETRNVRWRKETVYSASFSERWPLREAVSPESVRSEPERLPEEVILKVVTPSSVSSM